jgi:branched-chain amino acid aminotransferase
MSIIPLDDRDGWIWWDGRLIAWRDAKLHVLSHGLHYGSAVFEGERMYGDRLFALREHTARLFNSAALLDLDIAFDHAAVEQACLETCEANGLADCYVRPIAWRGAEQLGVSALSGSAHVAIAAWPWPKYFDVEKLRRGIRLTWAKYRRPNANAAPTSAKAVGLYMICTVSKNAAERAGYDDALMLDSVGNIAETTGANIFFARDGELYTPIADCFLDGITRQTIMRIARATGVQVIETRIRPADLAAYSECFVVGTAAEVTPVREIAGKRFTPGELTRSLIDAYADLVRTPERAAAAAVASSV